MVKDKEQCQMEGTFIGCHGDGKAVPFTWRGARLCRACMRIAMVSDNSLFSALVSSVNKMSGGYTVPQVLADEYTEKWMRGTP